MRVGVFEWCLDQPSSSGLIATLKWYGVAMFGLPISIRYRLGPLTSYATAIGDLLMLCRCTKNNYIGYLSLKIPTASPRVRISFLRNNKRESRLSIWSQSTLPLQHPGSTYDDCHGHHNYRAAQAQHCIHFQRRHWRANPRISNVSVGH